jgi:hypothetical protein
VADLTWGPWICPLIGRKGSARKPCPICNFKGQIPQVKSATVLGPGLAAGCWWWVGQGQGQGQGQGWGWGRGSGWSWSLFVCRVGVGREVVGRPWSWPRVASVVVEVTTCTVFGSAEPLGGVNVSQCPLI